MENNALKDPIYTATLYQTLGECYDFDINVFMKELAARIPTFNAFHTADVYMSSFIDRLPDMSVETIEEILRIYNRNL